MADKPHGGGAEDSRPDRPHSPRRHSGHGSRSLRLHHHRLHVLAGGGRAAPLQALGAPRPDQRAAPDECAEGHRRAARHPVHHPRQRPRGRELLMNERTKSGRLSPPVQIALVAAGLLVLAVAGYMVLIKPKRAEASKLDGQIAGVRQQIADRQSASTSRQISVAVKTADLFRLAKALPSDSNMASVILELNDVATDAGIVFDSIAPQPAVAENAYQVQPITLTFSGNYFTLTDF